MTLVSGDPTGPSLRYQRLRVTWLLVLPFLYFSRPSPQALLLGALVSMVGVLLRSWAAGFINKDRELATGGPYGLLRHPLYLGSFLLGAGLSIAGRRWGFPILFLGLFVGLYSRTIRAEEAALLHRFGKDFESYRSRVPAFLPRLRGDPIKIPSPAFRGRLYRRNNEWQAGLGTLLGYGLLWVKMSLTG